MSELSRFVYFEAFLKIKRFIAFRVSSRKRIKGRKATLSIGLSAMFQLNENKHVKHKWSDCRTPGIKRAIHLAMKERKPTFSTQSWENKSIHKQTNGTWKRICQQSRDNNTKNTRKIAARSMTVSGMFLIW